VMSQPAPPLRLRLRQSPASPLRPRANREKVKPALGRHRRTPSHPTAPRKARHPTAPSARPTLAPAEPRSQAAAGVVVAANDVGRMHFAAAGLSPLSNAQQLHALRERKARAGLSSPNLGTSRSRSPTEAPSERSSASPSADRASGRPSREAVGRGTEEDKETHGRAPASVQPAGVAKPRPQGTEENKTIGPPTAAQWPVLGLCAGGPTAEGAEWFRGRGLTNP